MSIEYRMLGRLEVWRDEKPVELGAFRQRALLALLLANAGTVLSTDRLLDELWGEAGGLDKQSSLWVYISNLRTALEPARPKRSEGTILLTRAPGYVLSIDPAETDVGRFERSVAEGRALAGGDPAAASIALRTGLALWRGHAYEEFAYESWAQAEITRLDELRLEAIEDRIDAELRLGLSRELISELQSLARQHPLRERFVTLLMLALYRSGRVAEALRACSAYRARLVADFGIEPSPALRDLEHRILTDDPGLLIDGHGGDGSRYPRSGLAVRGYELREELGRGAFGSVYRAYQPVVGREVAIKVINPELADDPEFIRRFEAEAQLVAGLEHPHIVPLYDYWREPGAAFLVMRLVGTGSLADVLTDGSLPADRAATIFAQVASALRSAHRNGVVHRDVIPENILIDRDGNAYLSDFGVALHPGADAPGGDVQTARAPYTSPELHADLPASPASDVYSLAVVAATALTGLRGGYEQVRGALTPAVRSVLDRATATDPARRYADAAAFGRALTDALGEHAPPTLDDAAIENPYKGLRAFGTADAGDFFGRERLVERLIARLGAAGTHGRFAAVVGPSGSGKSSAVRAGLLPALTAGALPMAADWFVVEMTPAPHPFEQLEAGLVGIAVDRPSALLDLLLTPGGVRRAVHRVLPDDHSQLLLVIDQFEELFTQVDDDTAARFIDGIVDLVTAPSSRVHAVITLRADFYDRPLAHRGLGELVREGTEVITPMSIDELEAAITGPAGRVGVDVEPAVVPEIVGEILDRPGALPLLQFTLTELFEARAGRSITLAAYRAGGGITRTLARRADSLLLDLGDETRETVRRVFLRLVSLDDDGGSGTRRRALVAEVEELDRQRVDRVLDTFGRHRLLTFDRDPVTRGPTVEISHEALLTEWTTLRDWIDDARDDLRAHRQLAGELGAWTAAERSPDYLLRGGRLDASLAWAEATTIGLRSAEREFLDASVAARNDERQRRDAEAHRTSAAERRARRRARQLLVAAIVTALVAALGTFAWLQRQDARRAEAELARNQLAQGLARSSVLSLSGDPELSLLLAIESVQATADLGYAVPEAIDAAHWALQELGVQYDVTPDTPTADRIGPAGTQGVWILPVEQLVQLARANTDRVLTDAECRRYLGTACSASEPLTGPVDYLGGMEAYAAGATTDQPEVVFGISVGLDAQVEEWQRNLDVIGDRYGVRVRLQQFPINVTPAEAAAQGKDVDVYHLISPGELQAVAASRPLLDLRAVVDEVTLLEDYGRYLVSLTRLAPDGTWPSDTGPIHGVVVGVDSKALVWTKQPEFDDLGYEAPSDWQAFMTLADTIVADGRTPFCLELRSDGADGWPATDWVEMVVLRTGGPDLYDAWIRHDIPFDDPVVVEAIRTVGSMVHTPGYLDVSPTATSRRAFSEALLAFTEQPGACLMTPFPSFMPGVLDARAGLPVGTFAFPAFGTAYDDAVVGAGGIAIAVTDRPEVRKFMAALASPDWGVGAAQLEWPLLLPANGRFHLPEMTNPVMGEIVSGIQNAIRAEDFRFDASDSMPTEISGAFLDGMMRLFQEGSPENLDALSADIASDIELAWVEYDAAND